VTRSVFLTGASSGIGEGLAREFARRGWSLALAARRIERLEALRPELLAMGAARVVTAALDVTDFAAIAPVLGRARDELGRIDVVVANAGVGSPTPAGRGRLERIREIVDTDLTGAIATIEAALPILRAQGGGQLVAVTSVARYRGMPRLGAYSAAKDGLHRYLQSLRAELYREPIVVTELAPGYIDTDLNRGAPSRPFVVSCERGAAEMARLIERRVRYSVVPRWPWVVVAPLLRLVPTALLAPRGGHRP